MERNEEERLLPQSEAAPPPAITTAWDIHFGVDPKHAPAAYMVSSSIRPTRGRQRGGARTFPPSPCPAEVLGIPGSTEDDWTGNRADQKRAVEMSDDRERQRSLPPRSNEMAAIDDDEPCPEPAAQNRAVHNRHRRRIEDANPTDSTAQTPHPGKVITSDHTG